MRRMLLLLVTFSFLNSIASQEVNFDATNEKQPLDGGTNASHTSFFTPSPQLNKKRFYGMVGLGLTTYSVASYALYNSWYKDYPQGEFRFFDDGKEWLQMDKAGHMFSAYFQTAYSYQVGKWTGLNKKPALLAGALISTLSQSTIEVFDGFNTQWGFSVKDVLANGMGIATFITQEAIWNKQYVRIKESTSPMRYSRDVIYSVDSKTTSTFEERANNLFGSSLLERALKDYNVQTYWASIDVHEILGQPDFWPKWLNLAIGYGAGNLFGGFENKWTENGATFDFRVNKPRYRQYYLSLDLNLHKFRTKSHLFNGVLDGLNIFKVPAPAIEYGGGEWRFHLMFW